MNRVLRDHHNLRRNLNLNGNYISNDGGDEGIRITDDGKVGVNTNIVSPIANFEVFNTNVQLDGGTTAYQTSTAVISSAADFTEDMVGGRLIFDDGTDAGVILIFSNTSIVVVSTSQTVGSVGDQRAFKVYYPSVQVDTSGSSTSLKIGSMTIDNDEIDLGTSGSITIDAGDDIALSADGGNITMNDGTTTIFNFNVDDPALTISDDADTGDYFKIRVGTDGLTSIDTNDDDGATAHLQFNIDGYIKYAATNLWLVADTRTASSTSDSTFIIQETLNLSSGAGGSDTHYGIRYQQTQTNIGGWDNVYLMYLDGGTDKVFSIDNNANANIDGTLTIDTIAEVGSDTDKFLMSDSGAVKYVTGANLLSYAGGQAALTFGISDTNVTKCGAGIVDDDFIRVNGTTFEGRSASEVLSDIGAQATVTAGTNCTFSGATLNVDDAFIKNDADDTMAGKLTIDVDYTGTTSESSDGLYIDYDATGNTGSGQTISNCAINASVNSSSQTNAGTVTNYGIRSIATGGTSGTQTSVGGYFKGGGADSNYALVTDGGNVGIGTTTPDTLLTVDGTAKINSLKLYEDGSNYVDFNVAADGELDISTTGTDADITLDSASDITLDSSSNITLESSGWTKLDSGSTITLDSATGIFNFYDAGDGNDAFKITVTGGTGATKLQTLSEAADGHLSIVADGHVEFDGCGVGFDQVTATFDATDTDIDFRTGNKQKLTLTADITDVHFQFPASSGNFLCLFIQDATGGWDVTNWKTKDAAGNAGAGNSGVVKWAGGSATSLTETGGKTDIISIYWDADGETAYAVASENF